jgi:hypothetical protein
MMHPDLMYTVGKLQMADRRAAVPLRHVRNPIELGKSLRRALLDRFMRRLGMQLEVLPTIEVSER